MNCLDCSHDAVDRQAVAICGRCGAALCPDHVIERDEVLVAFAPIRRPVPVEPAARRLRCSRCDAAEQAQARWRAA